MATIERVHWLASCPKGFDLFTDHNNLIFISDPLSLVPDLSQASMRKVIRWAVRRSIYYYECTHLSGVDSVWADLLSRWTKTPIIRRLIRIPPLVSASADDFEWPSPTSIAEEQSKHTKPPNVQDNDGLLVTPSNKIWIPQEATDLQIRLFVIAHTSASGHRGQAALITAITSRFHWDTVEKDTKLFVSSCIHCLSTTGGAKVPRPFGPAVFGTKPDDLLQFDYLKLGESTSGDKYVLMMRDDHSAYAWLYPTPSANA